MALSSDHHLILGLLSDRGTATAAELGAATGKSQPTVSRLLAHMGPQIVKLGKARATRYGAPKSIHGRPAQHTVWWTDEQGGRTNVGTLTYLANETVYVESRQLGDYAGELLPWYLTTLRAEGFLGRIAARALATLGVESEPERWSLETILYAALQVHDAPGAITLGFQDDGGQRLRLAADRIDEQLDAAAETVATTLPAGSSAGGEQPKFLAQLEDRGPVIVKFSPPLDTPGGRRWSDLLYAEQLASSTLARHGLAAAGAQMRQTAQRAYLISERFDRIAATGRRHVVSIGNAHRAFVHGVYRNWAESCEALASRGSLAREDADRARTLLDFGRLIGNTDMHSGNLALFVQLQDVRKGRFRLAPVYDMLPMRWRPDARSGGVAEYTRFAPDGGALASPAAPMAREFWQALAALPAVSRKLRTVAGQMVDTIQEQAPLAALGQGPRG
ncbi:HipA domain-containing protein [Ramlibacter sp. AN1133]|uniref:HipA domain-containing protein n=1 Tax=Ramlibacter sp. AN1133 TaxID=3133429 RepID=UPI0030BD2DBC